jgi:hypothetical protein
MWLSVLLICSLAGQQPPAHQPSVLVTTYKGSDEVMLWGQGDPDGRMFEYTVTKSEFGKLPAWLPEKEAPPLTIARAIEIAKKATRADHPEFVELMPWEIHINQVGSYDGQSRWFYVVRMYPVVNGSPSISSGISVVVLMNGTVVKPHERKAIAR